MGSETWCSQHWSCYLVSLSDLLVCKQDTETSALKISFESTRTGFVVLKFYSFKVKNKDKEVCFDSIKGICWFVCSLWFGWNVWSSVFFFFLCVAICVVNILDFLFIWNVSIDVLFFRHDLWKIIALFVIFFFFFKFSVSYLIEIPKRRSVISMFFRAVAVLSLWLVTEAI